MIKQPCVYFMGSSNQKVVYIGVTSNLPKRVWEHKNNVTKGFTQKYNAHLLLYYEVHETMESAITREKQIKKWERPWKEKLIIKMNPSRVDLFDQL